MGYANTVQFHPDCGYEFSDQSGSFASHSFVEARQALIDSGRTNADELLQHARKNWLKFVAVQSAEGPRFAIEQNGDWTLASDHELYDLLTSDGLKPAEAKAIMCHTRSMAVELVDLARLIVKLTL